MSARDFAVPIHALAAAQLARVVDVADPQALARVKVELYAADTPGDVAVWARVACPFAGSARGGFFIPDVGDEVLVVLLGGDPRAPIVVGGLWNGSAQPPETIGSNVDRWSITGKAGTAIRIEETPGNAKIECKTPGGVTVTLTDAGGGKTEIVCAGNTVTIDPQGIRLEAAANVEVRASRVSVSAATVNVDAAMSRFSGMVSCDVLQANSVISASYTPGAGNIW